MLPNIELHPFARFPINSPFFGLLSRKESMNFVSSLVELVKVLWGLASKPLGYIYNLKENVVLLRNETEDLKAKSEDVKPRVKREEEGGGVQPTRQVQNRLDMVQEFVGRVDQVLREAEERRRIKCLCGCLPLNCWSSYKLEKRVDQMLNEARELQPKEGEFNVVTLPLPPPRVLKMPMDKTVGLDIFLRKVWKWLVDEKQVGVIGLYGTGGVGKTILMKRINKELSHANHGFEVVIWMVVSRQVNEDHIQDAIRKRLDLSNIGVPHYNLENGSKVVLTTRLKHVCDQMGANKTLEVQCLTPEKALKLFKQNVGKSLVDSHREIQDLAKDITEECKGLPLALITVRQAMAKRDNPTCFFYCCLFLEDYPIRKDELIELWIEEGLLEDTYDVYNMRDEGEYVLGSLKMASLLESRLDEDAKYVKMHDVICDMATWIAHDRGQTESKLLVIEREEDMSEEMISKWGEAEKVSLWENGFEISIGHHPGVPTSKLCFHWVMGLGQVYEEEMVEELGCMQHLTDLSINVFKSSSALKIFKSLNLQRSIRRVLIFDNPNDLTRIVVSHLPHLEVLHLLNCAMLREMEITQGIGQAPNCTCFPNLVEVWVSKCGLLDLSWLGHAPKLRKLYVSNCDSMEKIIGDGIARKEVVASGLFSWVSFRVLDYPGLKKLPLDTNRARGSFKFTVHGDKYWWAKFERDLAARVTFQWDDESLIEEMTFGEAVRKMKHGLFFYKTTIGFGPSGPSEKGW
ncbi:hypothetical protein NL676_026385 [Syzygium grande]|nr:hypothetical protein NL676_026385 [Syzygium grande]